MAPASSLTTAHVIAQIQDLKLKQIWQFLAAFIFFRLLWNKFQRHLTSIPGPTLAAYTKFWRLYDVWKGQAHITAIELHRKHGPVVRIGPNHVSIGDPSHIQTIYNIKENYTKSAFYPVQSGTWNKKIHQNIFSTRDPAFHRSEKRKIASAYSLPNLLESEPAMDSCIRLFMEKLDEYAAEQKSIDLGAWLQYFAFDVVGEVTFAKKLGFLEEGKDVDGIIKTIENILTYAALCGQVPEYHKFLLGSPLFNKMMPAAETFNAVLLFTLKAINTRASIKRDGELINADVGGRDMLSRWAYVKSSDPLKMNTRDIVVGLTTNVFAGSDTTAIALRAIVYYLCKNPSCMAKVVQEIDAADEQGKLSIPITYKETTTVLRYFCAVLKEATRLHPSVGLLMERHVPAEGVTMNGRFIPGGTIVGINPWVTNRDETLFPNPDDFDPERWLTVDDVQLRQMDNVIELNFGGGARKCIGRNISMIEMHKVVPQLLRQFTVELTHPEKEWTTCNHWFVQQSGLICNVTRRSKQTSQ
ncbi:cytochrome P450 oxidoreductase [Zopfia rhizophila CBS 207.26]|uniref:Cytochrome P450 oxidoreductase n=1 Tax=Zopfia rhizophila CBS 207.26 TaxID=1314779 RepID=A0A6A6DRN3_9PEZI|nr:cytochrome P450 oxidoreductase [Zopfia rhizophila CBS 207.26]